MYAVQGPDSPKAMELLLEQPVSEMKRFAVAENAIAGIPVYIHRSGFTGENGFEVYCAADKTTEIRGLIAKAVEAAGGREIYTLEVYVRSIPMEKGFALKQDFKHLNPFECGMGWSVDLDKDFIGKEATLQIKENPRWRMAGLEFEWESTEDISIWERVYLYGVEVGRCAQAIYGYTVDKNIGFATLRADVPDGAKVTVGPNGSPATVVSKVFC
jgi:glycine cleavage system aminomethyltransferase T